MIAHPMPDVDFLFKVVLLGDAGVGKSSILRRFVDGTYDPHYCCTIGVEFGARTLQIGCACVRLQIWDTAGAERYRAVSRAYYRGAVGVMLVYDVTSRMSFRHLDDWIGEVNANADDDPRLVILGSKCDVDASKIEVPTEEAAEYAQSVGAAFMEVSARLGKGVDEAFALMAEDVLRVKAGMDARRPGCVRLPGPGEPVPCATAHSSSLRCC